MPMSASVHRCRTAARPGSSRWPGLRRKKVTVAVACTTGPSARPVEPSRPLGTSTASTGLPEALTAATTSAATPSSGRARPAPNSASMMRSAPARIVRSTAARRHRPSARPWRPHRPSDWRGAPSRPRRTRWPRSRSSLAATKPSPPLLPGPHSTAMAALLPPARRIGRLGHGGAGILHELEAGHAGGDGQRVGLAHLGGGEQLVAGQASSWKLGCCDAS